MDGMRRSLSEVYFHIYFTSHQLYWPTIWLASIVLTFCIVLHSQDCIHTCHISASQHTIYCIHTCHISASQHTIYLYSHVSYFSQQALLTYKRFEINFYKKINNKATYPLLNPSEEIITFFEGEAATNPCVTGCVTGWSQTAMTLSGYQGYRRY